MSIVCRRPSVPSPKSTIIPPLRYPAPNNLKNTASSFQPVILDVCQPHWGSRMVTSRTFLLTKPAKDGNRSSWLPSRVTRTRKPTFILAGDIHQLGPIVHSPLSASLGLATSYLHRITQRPIYNMTTGKGITYVSNSTVFLSALTLQLTSFPIELSSW